MLIKKSTEITWNSNNSQQFPDSWKIHIPLPGASGGFRTHTSYPPRSRLNINQFTPKKQLCTYASEDSRKKQGESRDSVVALDHNSQKRKGYHFSEQIPEHLRTQFVMKRPFQGSLVPPKRPRGTQPPRWATTRRCASSRCRTWPPRGLTGANIWIFGNGLIHSWLEYLIVLYLVPGIS